MGRERFAEVAIVGGGVMGASIAAHLAERKVGRVVVFEREDALGTGSTAKAAGGRAPAVHHGGERGNVAVFDGGDPELSREDRGGRGFRAGRVSVPAELGGGSAFGFRETAVVQRALGAPVEVITPEEAARILPGIVTDDLVGATFCGEDGVATPGGAGGGGTEGWPDVAARSCGAGAR